MANELHIGIKMEPWGGGAHVGKLKGAPDPAQAIPETTLDVGGGRARIWWLDGKIPDDEDVRRELEAVARDVVSRHIDDDD